MAIRLNLASGPHPLAGFVNLDKETGWCFEDGLSYPDESVDAITESHGLLYVELRDWPFVFAELARVLKPGGVLRVTEDATDDPDSERYGGFPGARTMTSARRLVDAMHKAGLSASKVGAGETIYRDASLIQDRHGGSPKCTFVEGVKV